MDIVERRRSADKKKMTVICAELPEDVEAKRNAKELNMMISPPPAARDAHVVLFMDDQISAIELMPWVIMTYSFFPNLGTAFIGHQATWLFPPDVIFVQELSCDYSFQVMRQPPRRGHTAERTKSRGLQEEVPSVRLRRTAQSRFNPLRHFGEVLVSGRLQLGVAGRWSGSRLQGWCFS